MMSGPARWLARTALAAALCAAQASLAQQTKSAEEAPPAEAGLDPNSPLADMPCLTWRNGAIP
jgi:hypothetical protein